MKPQPFVPVRATRVAITSLLACFLAAATASAVVRNDGTVGNPEDFPCSVEVGTNQNGYFCTGTVICGGAYVITAAHCLDGETPSAGQWKFRNQDGVEIFGNSSTTVRRHPTADIAIICLNGTFDDSYDLYMGTIDSTTEVCFAGRGASDTTPGSGPPADIAPGTFRAGYNRLDRAGDVAGDELGFDFDLAGGTGTNGLGNSEGTTFGGDSGMGYFVTVGGTTFLAGVHGGILGSANLNTDGVISYGTNVQNYAGWIGLKGVPEPSRLILALLGALAIHSRRRH